MTGDDKVETTILLITNRPFHNKVLAKRLRSYYFGQDKITAKPLLNIGSTTFNRD